MDEDLLLPEANEEIYSPVARKKSRVAPLGENGASAIKLKSISSSDGLRRKMAGGMGGTDFVDNSYTTS